MRILSVPRPRRMRPRHIVFATFFTTVVVFRKWIYCILAVIHTFATWNLRSINFVGTHGDGFPLDFVGIPSPPNVNVTDLLGARRTIDQARLSIVPLTQLTRAEEFAADADRAFQWGPTVTKDEMVVPPILHQVLVGMKGPAPEKWLAASNACRAIHPDWKIMTWDDAAAEDFIQREHGWFYDTWMNYRYNIQKADSLRYLVLYTYGGAYLDMDIQCLRPLDPLRKFPFLAIAAHPVGISNSFIMAAPKTLYFQRLVENLQLFNRFFFSTYPTVMFSTGCMYVSVQHSLFSNRDELKVIGGQQNRINGAVTTPLFKHLGSSSWHSTDAKLFVKLGKFLKAVPLFGSEGHDAPAAGVDPHQQHAKDGAPLFTFIFLMIAVLGCVASFRFCYMRRAGQRSSSGGRGSCLSPSNVTCEEQCCKSDSVVVMISEKKEPWSRE